MAVPVYNYVTVLDEIRDALGWAGTDSKVTDVFIKRFIYENLESMESTYSFQKITTGLYKCFHGRPWGLFLWLPTFTGTDDATYTVNCRGSIEVTAGAEAATSITVTGSLVNFSNCMVQILHWLATHRCQELSMSVGGASMTPTGVKDELIAMAQYWQGITRIA